MGSVTKATPIQFTDSKSGTKKRRGRKTALPGYYTCLSRDLLLMASGADTHTHIHQRSRTKRFQETRRARPSASRAWFKNFQGKSSFTNDYYIFKVLIFKDKAKFVKTSKILFLKNFYLCIWCI